MAALPGSRLNNAPKRRVGAPGLQDFLGKRRICRPGAFTGRFFNSLPGLRIPADLFLPSGFAWQQDLSSTEIAVQSNLSLSTKRLAVMVPSLAPLAYGGNNSTR
jgi:hypothetical protein